MKKWSAQNSKKIKACCEWWRKKVARYPDNPAIWEDRRRSCYKHNCYTLDMNYCCGLSHREKHK